RHIVVFSDYLTRWPEAFAVPQVDAEAIARLFMEEIVCRHGCPLELLSDRGKNFLSAMVAEVCRICDTRKVNTTSYWPQTDGLVERFNKTLATILSMYVSSNQRDWDVFVPYALFSYRTSVQSSSKETPFYLVYSRDARLPIDIAFEKERSPYRVDCPYDEMLPVWLTESRRLARSQIEHAQNQNRKFHDRKLAPLQLKEGDLVYAYTPRTTVGHSRKLTHHWFGPYKVVALRGNLAFLMDPKIPAKAPTWVNLGRLKRAYQEPVAKDHQGPTDQANSPRDSTVATDQQTPEHPPDPPDSQPTQSLAQPQPAANDASQPTTAVPSGQPTTPHQRPVIRRREPYQLRNRQAPMLFPSQLPLASKRGKECNGSYSNEQELNRNCSPFELTRFPSEGAGGPRDSDSQAPGPE
ncbi:MAG: DDE-type integrase/transposase/recombinase, partial [Chloroflexi bacterium]|nr:DDE-type integrase/transposase/recombinase [Chloroflexota bacterium]